MESPVHLSSDGGLKGNYMQRGESTCPRSPSRNIRKKTGPAEPGHQGLPRVVSPREGSHRDPKTIQKCRLVVIKGFESLGRRPGKDLTDKLFLNGADFIRLGNTQGQIFVEVNGQAYMDFNTLRIR